MYLLIGLQRPDTDLAHVIVVSVVAVHIDETHLAITNCDVAVPAEIRRLGSIVVEPLAWWEVEEGEGRQFGERILGDETT